MQTKSENPYYAVAPIGDPAMFFGQVRLLRKLYSALMNHQCISLVGWPHFGKTSILQCVGLPEMQQGFACDLSRHILVFIDIGAYLKKTADDFFTAVSKEIIAKSRGRLDIPCQAGDGQDGFSGILDQIQEQGFHTVLLMDVFDTVTRNKDFDPEFFAFLRSQATLGKVSYVTASFAPLSKVGHPDIEGSPFFNIFSTCYLEPLRLDEARALIAVPASRAGLPFTEQEIAWVLKLAGRHPFFIQRICYFLFEEKSHSDGTEVNQDRIRKQAYKELSPHFEDIWEKRLQEHERELLKLEAQRIEVQQRQLPEFSESALFRAFVQDKCQVAVFQMTKDEVEKVLDKLDDVRFLAESNLRQLKIVSMRVKKENTSSTIERGMSVREVLNEAFERLRGSGARNDSAPEWRSYNILYYRYFKYHLKNEVIAARLFISPRQYFRERNKAIEALYENLLEMEAASNKQGES
ncbi:MAG: hypothetical protein JO202_20320 [Ktedonobacteraceae bacterium]|nr:hypothetical protein [Ktedonobacteraceae bacterium]